MYVMAPWLRSNCLLSILSLGMPTEIAPPPLYCSHHERPLDVQLLIVPAAGGIDFQKGYLGAEGERAAVEGEIHIKGAQPGLWKEVSVISYVS